ncbi:MAG: type II toxin-antitoxin system HicA family toxin [Anaerobutyricum sp.]
MSGSHHQYKKAGVSTLATIPNHGKKDIYLSVY